MFLSKHRRINVLLTIAALIAALLYVRVRTNMYNLSYRMNSNIELEKEFEEKNRKLKVEAASLKAPVRIGKIAGEKMGLKLGGSNKTIAVD